MQQLQTAIAQVYYGNGLKSCFIGARVLGWLAQTGDQAAIDEQQQAITSSAGGTNSDKLVFLSTTRKYLEATELDWPAKLQRAKELDDALRKESHPISRVSPAGHSVMFSATAHAVARRDATIVAIALERYRMDQGQFPETTNDLVPKYLPTIPTDPFDGKPLRYKKLELGCLIYSVGADLNDDGGEGPTEPDCVVRVRQLPPLRRSN